MPSLGLTPEQLAAARRFAKKTGLGADLFNQLPPQRKPHVGACACPRCVAPLKAPKQQRAPRQPWTPIRSRAST